MNLDEILALAQATAQHLGIHIQYPQLVLDKMKPLTPVPTVLLNENWTLWIDKHYIAYSSNFAPEVIYVMVDHEHISEELRGMKGLIEAEKSAFHVKTLTSIMKQLRLAKSVIGKSNEECYLFEVTKSFTQYTPPKSSAPSESFILTLCGKCRSYFENTGEYKLHRADHSQYIKEPCGYCALGHGFDYAIIPRRRKERI